MKLLSRYQTSRVVLLIRPGYCLVRETKGTNTMKVISEVYAFLYCRVLSLGGKVNTRRMSQPDIESIFTKIIY